MSVDHSNKRRLLRFAGLVFLALLALLLGTAFFVYLVVIGF